MEILKKKGITLPAGWQFLVLVPFSLCYGAFIVLGNWQKSAEYSNLQNIGRIILRAAAAYAGLLIFCMVVPRKDDLKRRPGRWYVFLVFFCNLSAQLSALLSDVLSYLVQQ